MKDNILNLTVAIILSIAIIFGWQQFYEKPKNDRIAKENKIYQQKLKEQKKRNVENAKPLIKRDSAIAVDKRVAIKSNSLTGSISLKGLRFDDLTLLKYRKNIDQDTSGVDLLSPAGSDESYFAEIGWYSPDSNIDYPNSSTIWESDTNVIIPGKIAKFHWKNKQNITFQISVEIDENYMFKIKQTTINNSKKPISAQYYGLINKIQQEDSDRMMNILHRGMIGSVNSQLQEYSYDKIKEDKKQNFAKNIVNWIGITDKYWLAALIPDKSEKYSSNYSYGKKSGKDQYQADFISSAKIIEAGEVIELTHRLFAGAKKVDLLDKYESEYDIKLFDRAIDFGWFYILTKPIFNAMNFFYGYVGNFGISIMIVTVLIKLIMFTLSNKSYRSMKKMKKLQPEMERLKELYSDDKARLNQEVMALYKKEKVNPVSGCLPLLLQIPVFFSIYKVLYVTIEMRHAPFYGWIKDLSAPDPTTIFNLFGLLPFTPPSFLMIGAWPIIMAASMFFQQKMNPKPADPVQAQVMSLMPLMFLFMFASFPVGLLIYWSWNNFLSIIQQIYINKLDKSSD